MFDVLIILVVAFFAFAGWRKGFVARLLAIGLSLVGLYAMYAGPGAGLVPSGTAGLGLGVVVLGLASTVVMRVGGPLVALVHRVGLLRRTDHVLGVPLGALTGAVATYVALVAIVSFDNAIAPFHGKATVDQATVAAMRASAAANPQFAVMIDPSMLDAMAAQVAKAAIPADQLGTFDQSLAFYETSARPALLTSVIAPILLSIGERLPIVGRHAEFPAK